MTDTDLDAFFEVACAFHELFPDAVLVGGSAAALHAKHRVSFDQDHVFSELVEHFAEYLEELEAREDWETARIKVPKLILGNFKGVETGLRQLIRTKPLETETIRNIRVPSLPEMVRIKAWLVISRNALRDYVDLAALYDTLENRVSGQGPEALANFDDYYSDIYRQGTGRAVSPLIQLARQLADPIPHDLQRGITFKRISPGLDTWDKVCARCRTISQDILASITDTHAG